MNEIEKTKGYELDDLQTKVPAKLSPDYLYVSSRQVSWLTASLLLLSFFVFMAGYFFGQRKMLEHVHATADQEVLADTIYANACTACEPMATSVEDETLAEAVGASSSPEEYYAQLIGFGTFRAAHKFVDRLKQKDMPVEVKERHSRTAQGKEIIWYQVVTEPFQQRDDLVAFVDTIKKEEKLHDIRIVACQ